MSKNTALNVVSESKTGKWHSSFVSCLSYHHADYSIFLSRKFSLIEKSRAHLFRARAWRHCSPSHNHWVFFPEGTSHKHACLVATLGTLGHQQKSTTHNSENNHEPEAATSPAEVKLRLQLLQRLAPPPPARLADLLTRRISALVEALASSKDSSASANLYFAFCCINRQGFAFSYTHLWKVCTFGVFWKCHCRSGASFSVDQISVGHTIEHCESCTNKLNFHFGSCEGRQ